MATYIPTPCSNEDYQKYLKDPTLSPDGQEKRYKCTKTKIQVVKDAATIKAHSTFLFDLTGGRVLITEAQVDHLSDPTYTSIVCEKIPQLYDFIRGRNRIGVELSFMKDQKRPLYIPINKSVAAGVILAFYNGLRDPIERVISIFGADTGDASEEISRLLTTYYISCLKYLTDVDLTSVVVEGETEHLSFMLDDQTCIPTAFQEKYLKLKESDNPIPAGTIAFHAVYGAYVLCRPVANKREFRQWVLKRYNAFLSSIQQTAEANVYPDVQNGGTRVNNLVVSRPTLRKAVFKVIQSNYADIRTSAIKNHIKMLTALAEMTTYSLVQRVIATGGSLIFLKPLPEQVISFMKEKKTLEDTIVEKGYNKEDLIYIHLFMPHTQCFKSAQYADLIVTANVIEEHLDPKNKTLDRYRAKIEGATINTKQIKAFLSAQSTSLNCVLDNDTKDRMKEIFGDSVESMVEDAERVMKIISRQSRIE